VAAIQELHKRVRRCEQALGFEKRPIGFDATTVCGDRIEQDEDDPDVEELP
jgi:hypothetical protein